MINSNTALLVMDMQSSILNALSNAAEVSTAIAKAITHAHNNLIPVIYIVVSFRENMPEIHSNNKAFSATKERMRNMNVNDWIKIDNSVAPSERDIIVVKRRVSAFTGSDLEIILRSMNITHLVLSGIITSGVVLSTVREAADKDYILTVLSNACTDRDDEVHQILINKIFPRQATVITTDQWMNS